MKLKLLPEKKMGTQMSDIKYGFIKCFPGKAVSITNSVYVSVALIIQHSKRMRLVTLSAVACSTLPHFSTSSHKRQDFPEKSY
jgi:hypothetical protein